MNLTSAPDKKPARRPIASFKLMLPAVFLFFAIFGFNIWRLSNASQPEVLANGIPAHPQIEERYGIRFTGLYVVGKSGLIDLRYRVVDAGKAKNFGHYTETSPMLISEDSGKRVEVTIMMLHNHRVEGGRIYYILFRNTDNAIQPGSKVTIQIDDLLLENFIAQ